MASTTKEKKASKKYYDRNKKYREEKIRKQVAKQKNNKSETNEYHREYYAKNGEYRSYKRKYAEEYRKKEPIKSKAREYIKENCIDDEFYINLTNKEKNIIEVLNILGGDDNE